MKLLSKKTGISAGAFVAASGALTWLYAHFTPIERTERVERVQAQLQSDFRVDKLIRLKNSILERIYFLESQVQKYPEDRGIQQQLRKAREDLQDVRNQIEAITSKESKAV